MNLLTGVIEHIDISGNLSLIGIKVGECQFKSIVVETPKTVDYLIVGGPVNVMFKETEVIIGIGDNILVHVGYAIQKVSAEEAAESWQLFDEMLAAEA